MKQNELNINNNILISEKYYLRKESKNINA